MTFNGKLKLTACAVVTLGLLSGAAMAGDGHKDCNKTKTTAQKATATSTTAAYPATATAVAGSSERAAKMKKIMTYDDALALCTRKKVDNVQACVDKKTGKAKPES